MGAYKFWNPTTNQYEITKAKSIINEDGTNEVTPDSVKTMETKLAGIDTGAQVNQTLTSGNGMSAWTATNGNLTIALGTPTTVTNATTNSVSTTGHTHALTLTKADITALGIPASDTNTTYSAGNGLSLTGTSFAVGTPSTITNATTNSVTATSHTHALTVTKANVGLGSVLDYGIATKAEAEAGKSNTKYMTPLRVKEAINSGGALKYMTGTYTGNNSATNRKITVGVTPKVLFVAGTTVDGSDARADALFNIGIDGYTISENHRSGTGASIGTEPSLRNAFITTGGFYVKDPYGNSSSFNDSGVIYRWVALV